MGSRRFRARRLPRGLLRPGTDRPGRDRAAPPRLYGGAQQPLFRRLCDPALRPPHRGCPCPPDRGQSRPLSRRGEPPARSGLQPPRRRYERSDPLARRPPLRPRRRGGMTIEIVEAARSHMPAIQGIYGHWVTTGLASFEEIPPDAGELDRRRREIQAKGLPYLVALQGEALLGYAYAGPYRARPAYR